METKTHAQKVFHVQKDPRIKTHVHQVRGLIQCKLVARLVQKHSLVDLKGYLRTQHRLYHLKYYAQSENIARKEQPKQANLLALMVLMALQKASVLNQTALTVQPAHIA